MSRRHFGTDGIRGVANRDLTPELAFQVGQAAGRWLIQSDLRNRVAMGRDTRRSGPMLGAALAAGFCSVGVDVVALGVAPTPAIAFVAREGDFGLGAILSASHNPASDNGIKLIGHDGRKLTDEHERMLEGLMESSVDIRPEGGDVGFLQSDRSDLAAYEAFLIQLVPERLDGLRVALDAANGAAYELAPAVLEWLGATVLLTDAQPDGMNINLGCGATHPSSIQEFTRSNGADIGVAFDGDADRAIFSDERGQLINGDRMIGVWAAHWRAHGRMKTPTVVGTVMSNGGFERYLNSVGIELCRADVGDKYVAQQIEARQADIGGEQSGHIIFPSLGPTGDGLATMLELLRVLVREKRPASNFTEAYDPWPQLLVNLRIGSKDGWNDRPAVQAALSQAQRHLEGIGRLNVRPSGTQPVLRVMVEAETESLRDSVAAELLETLIDNLGGEVASRVDLTHALGD